MNHTYYNENNLCGLKKSDFQKNINGKSTDLFILANDNGAEIAVTNYGGAILAIMMPDKNGNALRHQPARTRRRLQVAAGHFMPPRLQKDGEASHADPANANEVNPHRLHLALNSSTDILSFFTIESSFLVVKHYSIFAGRLWYNLSYEENCSFDGRPVK